MKKSLMALVSAAAILGGFNACRSVPAGDDYKTVLGLFADPPAEYRSAPLWVWNNAMTRDEIKRQLEDFKAHGIGGAFIHPRPGLITPYLGQEWLDLCRYAVETGKSLGMKIWLYDENSYPSGFAGGHVPAEMPDAVRTGLRMTKRDELPPKFESPPVCLLKKTERGFEDVTSSLDSGRSGKGEYVVFDLVRQEPSPWYGGFTYVDIMRRDVTDKFIDITMNAYKRVIGDEFGATVPGVFQDEAEISPAGKANEVVNYTPEVFEAFKNMCGYDLKPHLPSLFEETGDWKAVRHHFYATLLDLFAANWAKPYFEYCAANNLALTGHYWEHEWPVPRICPDAMALSAYAQMPGIDILMNEWKTDSHAQFGNARAVKEIRSVANQLGRKRTLSETYGAGGWDLTFFDQKRIGDWEYALGVNFLNQHLSYATIKGARKRDHPLAFTYHEPWWQAYRVPADYFGRLSVVMSLGEQRNAILVLEPTTSAWMHYSPSAPSERLQAIGQGFQDFVHRLEAAQIEYDLAAEAILKDHGRVEGKALVVGNREYSLLVLPPGLENLNSATLALIKDFLGKGGKILSWVEPPGCIDGSASEEAGGLAVEFKESWEVVAPDTRVEKIHELSPPRLVFEGLKNESLLFHHRRELAQGELVFLANSSPDTACEGQFSVRAKSAEEWNLFTGRVESYPCEKKGGRITVRFSIPEGGSLLLYLGPEMRKAGEGKAEWTWTEVRPAAGLTVRPESPNVLTIDYCDLNLGGKTEKDLYFYDAQLKAFRHHGLPRNPWDSAVQYKTNILDLDTFPRDSGFEATYWLEVRDGVDLASLRAVIERPELYRVSVNEKETKPIPGEWWLDRDFGVFELGGLAKAGRNKIKLAARPFTIHTELEPIYILGNFRLESAAKGFVLAPPQQINLGGWAGQGMPFFGGAVRYEKEFELDGGENLRYVVELGAWGGAVAEVKAGENTAGYIFSKPFEADVTGLIKPGKNRIGVIIYGTLKNTLGPHHNEPPLGRAWPGSFQKGAKEGYPPGASYRVVDYGLIEDFRLKKGEER